MIPTRRGVAMLIVGVVLYGLAWQTQIGWFYVANAFVAAVFVVNLPLPWLAMRGLSATRRVKAHGGSASDIFEDDAVGVSIELRNGSLLPKSLITVREECPLAGPGDDRRGFLIAALAPRGSATAGYDVRCHRRGVFSFGPVRVHTSAPFGLFSAHRTLQAPMKVTVYPRALPMETAFSPGHHQGERPDSSPPVTSGEFRGSREFQHGDRLRNIHWRNSARSGRLMVKEFDRTPQGEVRVAFNPGFVEGQGRDTTLEYAVKVAASVARRCFLDGRPFRMWPAAREGGDTGWHGVLEHLAQLRPGPGDAVPELLGHWDRPGVSVVVVSAGDRASLELLERGPSTGGQAIAVLLEGFDASESLDAAEALTRAGIAVVRCGVGDLPAAVASLGAAIGAPRAARQAVTA